MKRRQKGRRLSYFHPTLISKQNQYFFVEPNYNLTQYFIKLTSMSDKFEFLGKVGEGAFATVYKVKRHEDSHIYAFKKMKAIKMTDRQLSNSLNQIRILASLSNPYIIGYKEAFYDSSLKSFCLVTEFAEGGDLSTKINTAKKTKTNIPESYIWRVALQLLFGIRALHNLKIFHRDIKPANILLSKNEECAKLADMNVSVISKTGMASTQTGTPTYASPQVWLERPYSGKSDIWSLGCLIYEMAALKPPFMAADLHGLKRCIIGNEFEPLPFGYSKELQAFIKLCLQKDQKSRPSAQQLLNSSQIKQKMREFPNEKFNQPYFPAIERNFNMVNTIRVDNGNFKSLQNKLPKCNYNNEKENEGNGNKIIDNSSCVPKLSSKPSQNEKLPLIKRPDSASKANQKNQKKMVNRVQVLKKLRC